MSAGPPAARGAPASAPAGAAATAAAADTGAAASRIAAPRWEWPVPTPHPVVRAFEAPATRYTAGHRGIDIGASPGARVVAPATGVVHFAGRVVDRGVVSVRHADGLISSFEPVTGIVEEGDVVALGSPIGVLDQGHCADGCLHFGVRRHGDYVSPLLFLGGVPPSVLLPTRRG